MHGSLGIHIIEEFAKNVKVTIHENMWKKERKRVCFFR